MTPEQFKQVSELSPKWQCEVDQKPLDKIEEIYKSEKKAPEKIPTKLTVGQKFLVTCRGEAQVIDPVKAKIYHSSKQNSPAQDFILKKFENKVWDAKQIQFVAASYLPAKINAPVLIGDGENYIFIENIEFELESVVEQQDIQLGQQQQENPEYPAFGGMKMHYPLWFWISLAVFLFVLLGFGLLKLNRYLSFKRMLKNLEEYRNVLSPYDQFYKNIRLMDKKMLYENLDSGQYIQFLEENLRLYLLRLLQVPTNEWKDQDTLSYLQNKRKWVSNDTRQSLKILLREFQQVKKSENVQEQDREQLLSLSRKLVERLNREKPKEQMQ